MKFRSLAITILLSVITVPVLADVRLPSVISNHMVLQQNSKANLWGWAEPGEKVSVKGSPKWAFSKAATANKYGKWKVAIATPKAGGPYEITIKAKNVIVLKDILIGEVWLCSGQSNMAYSLPGTSNAEKDIPAANYPDIRLFSVKYASANSPQSNCGGSWSRCSPKTLVPSNSIAFSAVAYYFGRQLHKELNVPIGLINSSRGSSLAEAWTRKEYLQNNKILVPCLKGRNATQFYNAMIAPLIPYTIRGVIWYQGEQNVGSPQQYQTLFPALIKNWRHDWNQGDFPFYFVQIAPYKDMTPELREAQLITYRKTNNTGIVVTTDIGDLTSIHPLNKLDVGKRLSLWALAKDYGRKNLVYSGPLYKSYKIQGNKIRICFDHTGSGLIAKNGDFTHFTIAGKDNKFVPAKAVIQGKSVVVSSDQVKQPKAVRFGWSNTAEPNFFNKEGLPASPFRTDK